MGIWFYNEHDHISISECLMSAYNEDDPENPSVNRNWATNQNAPNTAGQSGATGQNLLEMLSQSQTESTNQQLEKPSMFPQDWRTYQSHRAMTLDNAQKHTQCPRVMSPNDIVSRQVQMAQRSGDIVAHVWITRLNTIRVDVHTVAMVTDHVWSLQQGVGASSAQERSSTGESTYTSVQQHPTQPQQPQHPPHHHGNHGTGRDMLLHPNGNGLSQQQLGQPPPQMLRQQSAQSIGQQVTHQHQHQHQHQIPGQTGTPQTPQQYRTDTGMPYHGPTGDMSHVNAQHTQMHSPTPTYGYAATDHTAPPPPPLGESVGVHTGHTRPHSQPNTPFATAQSEGEPFNAHTQTHAHLQPHVQPHSQLKSHARSERDTQPSATTQDLQEALAGLRISQTAPQPTYTRAQYTLSPQTHTQPQAHTQSQSQTGLGGVQLFASMLPIACTEPPKDKLPKAPKVSRMIPTQARMVKKRASVVAMAPAEMLTSEAFAIALVTAIQDQSSPVLSKLYEQYTAEFQRNRERLEPSSQ
ncbi:hypothetical protein SARC_08570 [Sphaeroforma arctica JP610]|uniref:Uncharacterized protein n=1 Tax=Sphaeroforma arctica JP610 TaxID=667725 RepID=A0A0L0FQP0_9EUKA|nr:hypothetical protein SARC_08570 [Sphaeroforma arctica JP610]KNC79029.1 hypothetical protein SARC_08570 [Sphaeroforma arctica JP610]|eukprot:XP_014152931.1 hypothetical protein SARC_08570 [Sphaeroforma arctica JP610]